MRKHILIIGILILLILSALAPSTFGSNARKIKEKEIQSIGWNHQDGWPLTFDINSTFYSMIYDTVVCDLEGDGNLDVVVTYSYLEAESYIDAYNLDGSRRTDLGFPIFIAGDIDSGASIGDLDCDGDLEIVVSVPIFFDGICYTSLYVFEFDGEKFVESWHFLESIHSTTFLQTPALGDIDGDGDLEIIIGNSRKDGEWTGVVYAWHHNGSMVSGWPVTNNHAHGGFDSPALGDIDADGRLEVVAGSGDRYVYAWNGDGSLVSGNWPVYIGDCVLGQAPQIGDLDGDGILEVVQIGNNNGSIFVFDGEGNIIWTLMPPLGEEGVGKTPALGDIDGDGDLEVFTEINGYVYGWHHNGTLIDGWPSCAGALQVVRLSITIGDVDNDSHPDVLLFPGFSNGGIFAFHADGTLIEGWPYLPSEVNNVYSSPLIADLDNDGDVEVVFTYAYLTWPGSNGSFFTIDVLDLTGSYDASTMHWPMYQHDPRHTGLYGFGPGELRAYAHGPFYGLINEPVQFSGAAIGGYPPYEWHWDFGDTYTSVEQNPLHTYTSSGNYTVVLTVSDDTGNSISDITYAWIQTSNDPPNKPNIDGPTHGSVGTSYPYTFTTSDPDGTPIWYFIDWGDNTNTGWIGPYDSGTDVTKSHTWSNRGKYIIKYKAKDPYDAESPWGKLVVKMPRNKATTYPLLLRFLEQFPLLEQLFLQIMDLN